MALYEHIFIARQDISSQQVDDLSDELKEIIQTGGGTVTKVEHWGLRSLSYRINKNRKGHYVLFNLDTPYEALAELERLERLNEDIIRTLTIKVEELEEGPSAMKRGREERDFRGRGPGGGGGGRDSRPRERDSRPAPRQETAPAVAVEAKDTPAATTPAEGASE